jgi:hypothetical protein
MAIEISPDGREKGIGNGHKKAAHAKNMLRLCMSFGKSFLNYARANILIVYVM